MTSKSLEEHAQNWDLRHEDFKDDDFMYDVYSVMRQNAHFAPDSGARRSHQSWRDCPASATKSWCGKRCLMPGIPAAT